MSLLKNVNPNVMKQEQKHQIKTLQHAVNCGMAIRATASVFELLKTMVQDVVRCGICMHKGPATILPVHVKMRYFLVKWIYITRDQVQNFVK